MGTWTFIEIKNGYVREALVGDDGWDGYRTTPLPGTIPTHTPAAAHAAPQPIRLVLPVDCIATCDQDAPHERWECELLATTEDEWRRIANLPTHA
jgi:hypothetical protein